MIGVLNVPPRAPTLVMVNVPPRRSSIANWLVRRRSAMVRRAAAIPRRVTRSALDRLALLHVHLLGDARVGRRNLDGGLVRLDLHQVLVKGDVLALLDQ